MKGKTYLGRKLTFIKLPNFHWIFYNVCLISTFSTNTISFSVNYTKTCGASVFSEDILPTEIKICT